MRRRVARAAIIAITALTAAALPLPLTAEPLGEPVIGPKLICFKYSSFHLLEGERIVDFGGSPEGLAVTIIGSDGRYRIAESEIFAEPKRTGQVVYDAGGSTVFRMRDERSVRYGVRGVMTYSQSRPVLVIWLDGPAIKAGSTAAAYYRRIDIGSPPDGQCDQRFSYGWDLK